MEEKKKNGQLEEIDEALTDEQMDEAAGGNDRPIQLFAPPVESHHNYPAWDDPTGIPREFQPPQ